MFRKFKLKSNGLNKSMPSLVFDNDTDTTTKTADFGFQHGGTLLKRKKFVFLRFLAP